MLLGTWCLGFGLGNLDGWDGDYPIHLLPAGSSFYIEISLSCLLLVLRIAISLLELLLLFRDFAWVVTCSLFFPALSPCLSVCLSLSRLEVYNCRPFLLKSLMVLSV